MHKANTVRHYSEVIKVKILSTLMGTGTEGSLEEKLTGSARIKWDKINENGSF